MQFLHKYSKYTHKYQQNTLHGINKAGLKAAGNITERKNMAFLEKPPNYPRHIFTRHKNTPPNNLNLLNLLKGLDEIVRDVTSSAVLRSDSRPVQKRRQ